jgi:uncharacterized membrane protein YfcA
MRLAQCATIAFVWLATGISCSIFNAKCTTNNDCHTIYNKHYECVDHGCLRKNFDYSHFELFGDFMVIIISMITNAGGVGAGTVIIPVYMFFYNFVSSDAIPLSRITIFAGSLVNYIINMRERDPSHKNRLLIDYSLASVMMPLLLAGTQIGVMLSRFLPAASITFILVFYLTSNTTKVLKRAREESNKELMLGYQSIGKEKSNANNMSDAGSETTSLHDEETVTLKKRGKQGNSLNIKDGMPGSPHPPYAAGIEGDSERGLDWNDDAELGQTEDSNSNKSAGSAELLQIDDGPDGKVYSTCQLFMMNFWNIALMLFAFFTLAFFSLARGGEATPSIIGIKTCGAEGWIILAVSQLVSLGLSGFIYFKNKEEFGRDDAKYKDAGAQSNHKHLREKLIWASYSTGILAGLLGIGGGMVLQLYMQGLGMDPMVTTALSTFVVLFSSAATTFQFFVAGAIHFRHAVIFMILSLIGSLIGNLIIKALLKKYKRPSLLIWILFGVLCIATGVLPIEMALTISRRSSSSLSFGPFC